MSKGSENVLLVDFDAPLATLSGDARQATASSAAVTPVSLLDDPLDNVGMPLLLPALLLVPANSDQASPLESRATECLVVHDHTRSHDLAMDPKDGIGVQHFLAISAPTAMTSHGPSNVPQINNPTSVSLALHADGNTREQCMTSLPQTGLDGARDHVDSNYGAAIQGDEESEFDDFVAAAPIATSAQAVSQSSSRAQPSEENEFDEFVGAAEPHVPTLAHDGIDHLKLWSLLPSLSAGPLESHASIQDMSARVATWIGSKRLNDDANQMAEIVETALEPSLPVPVDPTPLRLYAHRAICQALSLPFYPTVPPSPVPLPRLSIPPRTTRREFLDK